jgi:uncharacterized membrane protein YccC
MHWSYLHPVVWLRSRDRGFAALRRATRTAIVMPGLFAIGTKVIDNPVLATFAAFGAFSMLLLVDFSGSIRDRLQAQATLAGVGLVFVTLGTLCARNAWLAAAAMLVVGFCVLFAGVVSSVLAGATTSLLLAFILPVTLPGPVSAIPDRLEGWLLASAAGLIAIAVLWPAPARDPLRAPAIAACRALAARLRTDVAYLLDGPDRPSADERAAAMQAAADTVATLQRTFIATPYRPTGLTTAARSLVRLIDELSWLNAIAMAATAGSTTPVNPSACAVKSAAAAVLDRGADLLADPGASADELASTLDELRIHLDAMERNATAELPIHRTVVGDDEQITEFITALDPSFRAQELAFAVTQVAANIDLGVAAERRTWFERLLGHQPRGLVGPFAAAQQRAAAHIERHSVWLHNSVRGAIGLGLAVLVADLTGVQHSFWVVLGTLSVLRSNALNTGQNVLRGLAGTIVGFVVGALLLVPIGTHTTVLWILLPIAILLAGVAPAAISFAAGQAAFTLVLVILFNIIAPSGWRVGLIRVEDIAIGCAVSLAVGLLFWPRGAAAALGQALAEAYSDSAGYLAAAVEFGMLRCDPAAAAPPAPTDEANRAAAAARRLDDTFRSYLAERGSKPVALADVTALVTGVVGLRLAADAVLDLWRRDDGQAGGDRIAARLELLSTTANLRRWYDDFAAGLIGEQAVRDALDHDTAADGRLVDAVRSDLREADGQASATAVRMIWTGDHLDAARRLQATLVGPARTTRRVGAFSPLGTLLRWPWQATPVASAPASS